MYMSSQRVALNKKQNCLVCFVGNYGLNLVLCFFLGYVVWSVYSLCIIIFSAKICLAFKVRILLWYLYVLRVLYWKVSRIWLIFAKVFWGFCFFLGFNFTFSSIWGFGFFLLKLT